jgi:hypothetical protein
MKIFVSLFTNEQVVAVFPERASYLSANQCLIFLLSLHTDSKEVGKETEKNSFLHSLNAEGVNELDTLLNNWH